MTLDTQEVTARYNISVATLHNYRAVIRKAKGIDLTTERPLYKSSVLDKLALDGKLGSKPLKAIANKRLGEET